MTKIKKTVWSKLFGFVIGFALVFSLLLANVGLVAHAETTEYAENYIGMSYGYIKDNVMIVDSSILVGGDRKGSNVLKARDLYENNLTEEDKADKSVVGAKAIYDEVWDEIFKAPHDVMAEINSKLQPMLDREGGVVYSDKTTFEEVKASFEALDANQQAYIAGIKENLSNYPTFMSEFENTYETYTAVKAEIERICAEIDRVVGLINDLETTATSVKYSQKASYDALVESYNKLDASAREEVNNQANEEVLETVKTALETIEQRATSANNAIANILYYVDGEMVANAEGEIVYDSKLSVEAATALINAIYDGTENVASLSYKWDEAEVRALVDSNLIAGLDGYDAAVAKLAEFKAQADAVESKINSIELTVDNNYKVLENTIVEAYDAFVALNFTEYGTHHNLQNYLAEDSKTKIENTKSTLVAVNAWIAKVAMFVDETATPETADSVISAILERGNVDEFISLDMDKVNELLSEHTELCGEDEIITKSVEDAKKVLDMIKARVEELEEEVQEVVDGLDELETLVTNGVKYSDKPKYEDVKAKYDALLEGALKDAVSEQAQALETVRKALEEIETRTKAAKEAIANIMYYLNGEMVANPEGEIVVASKESLDKATEAINGVYDGTNNIAELPYRWDDTEVNALVNAELIALDDLSRYEAAAAKFQEYLDAADAVKTLIDALEFSAENNYKALENQINSAYEAYVALNHTEYNGLNNAQDLLDTEVKDKIEKAKATLDNINAWILEVAKLVNAEATAENADSIIAEANALDTVPVASLDAEKVQELLNKYDELNVDDATSEAMKDAYEVLNKIKTRVEELNNEVEDVKNLVSNLPTEDIKYSDKQAYDEAKNAYDELDPIAKDKLNSEVNAEEVLNTVKTALDTIESNARLANDAIANIEYFKDGEMVKDPTGEIVYDSKTSVDLATEALAKVYDGNNNVANLPYKWDEAEVNALVESGLITNLDKYDAAKAKLDEYKAEADAVKEQIDALELSAENNYKVLENKINDVYNAYVALNKEGYNDHNNLQNFLDEDTKTKIVDAKTTLDNINAWILEVAKLVNADATAENADSIIAEANALETVTVATLDLEKVQELLNKYNELNTNEAATSSMKDAYDVLNKVKARVEELEEEVEEVIDDVTDFESMTSEGIKYSYKAKYEEVKSKYEALDQVAKDKVNETKNVETILETVKTALDEIKTRAENAQTAINNILYLVDGAMTTGETGEVVYASDVTITAAKDALAKIYDGTNNIASMDYAWDDVERQAFANDNLLTNLAKYDTAAAALEALKAEAKAVADKIADLEITAENNYKKQEDNINTIYSEFEGLNRGEFNNLQNYVDVDLANKIRNAKTTLDTVNAWILKVAQLVNVNATSEDADQVIADTLANGVNNMVKFNVNTVNAMIAEHTENFASDEVLAASVKDAYDVLMLIKARIDEINNGLKETIEDVVHRDRNGELNEEDYDTIKDTQKTHDDLDDSQKDLLDKTLEEESDTTYEEFLEIANKFLFSIYFKQAVDELYRQVGENYFTVEGYVMGKTLFSMYNTFDASMLALVSSYRSKLDTIDEAYAAHKDELLDYNKIKAEFDQKITDLTSNYQEKIDDLAGKLAQLQEAYANADNETKAELEEKINAVKTDLTNTKAELEREFDGLKSEFETLKNSLTGIISDEIDRELTALRNTLENSINSAKNELQNQINDLKKANEDLDKKFTDEISTLKKVVYIGGAVYGVLIIALAIGLISVSKKKNAAMKEGTVVGESEDADDDEE